MSTLEHEVIEKFRLLDRDAKKRVLEVIEQEVDAEEQEFGSSFNFDAWLAQVEISQITLKPDANGHVPSASELVNEVREEHDADILRSVGFGDSTGDRTD